jgi:hypothetical protein
MKLRQKLSSIAASWPTDPFRPNLQLKGFLEALSMHPKLTPQAVNAVRSLRDNELQKKVLTRLFPLIRMFYLPPWQYPVSQKILRPASKPLYYDRLVEAFEKSAQGIGRPWWKIFLG